MLNVKLFKIMMLSFTILISSGFTYTHKDKENCKTSALFNPQNNEESIFTCKEKSSYRYFLNSVTCDNEICTSVGDSQNFGLPLILNSTNSGEIWDAASNIEWPAHQTYFESVDCDGSFCILAGGYYTGMMMKPVIFKSLDRTNWSMADIIGLPADKKAHLLSVNCRDKLCTAVGYQLDAPLVLNSADQGKTWSQASFVELPLDLAASPQLTSVTCRKDICSAVGAYNNANKRVPLILNSTDNGNTWKLPSSIELSSDTDKYAYLNAVSCSESVCIAVGKYDKGPIRTSLILKSKDNGNTWHSVKSMIESMAVIEASLNSVTCNDTKCTSVGYIWFDNSSPQNQVLILNSEDQGETWNEASFIELPPPAANGPVPIANSITCNGDNCTIVGQTNLGNDYYPLILNSTDRNIWSLASEIELP
jgi:photosystem II stability/assembly factor-like uncharacterized protein